MMLNYIRPCAPTLRKTPPVGDDWVHEVKWDGYRLQAHKEGKEVRLYSRLRNNITERFPEVVASVAALKPNTLILDGELVAYDDNGLPNFHLLRQRRPNAVAWLFDVMRVGSTDLRHQPWHVRRGRLEGIIEGRETTTLRLNEIWPDGPMLLEYAASKGLEGIVSKHRNAAYVEGDTDAWIKCKVAGWTESNRGRFRNTSGGR